MRDTLIAVLAMSSPSLAACALDLDEDVEQSERLEALTREITSAELEIEDAIEIAQAKAPRATVFSAELVWIGEPANYEVGLLDGAELLQLDISASDGEILKEARREPTSEELATREEGAALVEASDGWVLIVQAAEVSVTGAAFEVRARPDLERLEMDLLAPDGVWRVTTRPDGSDTNADRVDTSDWELGDPGVPDSDLDGLL